MKNKITLTQGLIAGALLIAVSSVVAYFVLKNKKTPVAVPVSPGGSVVSVPKTQPVVNPSTNLGKVLLVYPSSLYNEDWTKFGDYGTGASVGKIVGVNGDWYVVDYYNSGHKYVYKAAVKIVV